MTYLTCPTMRDHPAVVAQMAATLQILSEGAPEDVAEAIPCGPDLASIAVGVKEYLDAGFTDVALVQVGDEGQSRFLDEAAGPLLQKLREL